MRNLLFVMLLAVSSFAIADTYPAVARGSYDGISGSGTYDNICKSIFGDNAIISSQFLDNSGLRCHRYNYMGQVTWTNVELSWSCPHGGTVDYAQTPPVCNVAACPNGQTRDSSGQCQSCQAGATSSASHFRGWATSPSWSSGLGSPGSLCNGQCIGTVSGDATECYASGTGAVSYPAQAWCDFPIILTGESCTEGDKSQATPQPPEYPKDPNTPCADGYNEVSSKCIQGTDPGTDPGTNPDPGTDPEGPGTGPGDCEGPDCPGTGPDPGTDPDPNDPDPGTDPGEEEEEEGGVDVPDPEAPDDFKEKFFQKSAFDNLLNWSPSGSGTCPTASFSAFGQSYSIDAHCQLAGNNFNVFRLVMMAAWTILALFVVLKD